MGLLSDNPEQIPWTEAARTFPIGQLPFGNTYLYVGDNPVNYIDPTGAIDVACVARGFAAFQIGVLGFNFGFNAGFAAGAVGSGGNPVVAVAGGAVGGAAGLAGVSPVARAVAC